MLCILIIYTLGFVDCWGQNTMFEIGDCPTTFSQYKAKLLAGIKVEEMPRGNSISIDPYSSSAYKDNTLGVQKVVPVMLFQLNVINKKESIYKVKCTDSIEELLAVPQPFVGKLYDYDTRPERHEPNEIHTIGLLNQYGSGKLMNMFQNTIIDDSNKVGYLFYFLKEEQYWRDNFMVLNKKTGKTSFYLSARDTNPFRKFTGSKAFKEIGSIKELIDYRYGSVEKLAELLEDEQEEQTCKCTINNVAEMEATIKQSWQIRMAYMPEDTVKAIRQFMSSLQKIAALDTNQMRILKANIQFRDDIPFIENCTESDASFYINRKNYGSFIKKSLTRAQYAQCVKTFKQQADCAKRIHFYMWHYTGKDDIEDRIRAILKE